MAASGKRRARLPSMRDVAARSLLVPLLASLSAAAALLGTPLLALVAGFVAVALVIDFIFPVTGFLRIDSQHAFQRLAWQRRREALAKRRPWRREHRRLELLPGELEQTARRRHLGIQPIPLEIDHRNDRAAKGCRVRPRVSTTELVPRPLGIDVDGAPPRRLAATDLGLPTPRTAFRHRRTPPGLHRALTTRRGEHRCRRHRANAAQRNPGQAKSPSEITVAAASRSTCPGDAHPST